MEMRHPPDCLVAHVGEHILHYFQTQSRVGDNQRWSVRAQLTSVPRGRHRCQRLEEVIDRQGILLRQATTEPEYTRPHTGVGLRCRR